MATLPGGQIQVYRGQRNPVEAPTQSIASAAQPWAAFEQSAGRQLEYEEGLKKASQAIKATQAGLDLTREMNALQAEYRTRNDYDSFEGDFNEKSAAIKARVLGALEDPEVVQLADFDWQRLNESKLADIRELKVSKMQDAGMAVLEGLEEETALAASADPAERDALYKRTVDTIKGMRGAGMIGAADAQRRINAIGKTMDKEGAAREILANPAGFDASRYPRLAASDIMTLQGQAYTQVERAKKEIEEKTAGELFQKSIDGALTLEEVRANAGKLDYHDARDLEKLAVQADPVTQGGVYADLLDKMSRGEDVQDLIRTARFDQRALSNADYRELLDRNEKGAEGFADPVKAGEKYVMDSVGASANAIDVAASRVIGNARMEYIDSVEKFKKKEGRDPSLAEVRAIGDKVVEAFDSLDLGKIVTTLPKPQFMSVSDKNSFNSRSPTKAAEQRAIIEKAKQATRTFYLQQYGGNKEAAVRDPDYLKEMERIRNLEQLINASAVKGQ